MANPADIGPMNESLMRQERKAEGNALLQVLQPWVAIQIQLAQGGAATPLNTDALLEYVLEQYDIQEPKRFFSKKVPPAAPAPGGGAPGQPGAPEGQPQGITAPQSIDPAVSPSASVSLSPATIPQRTLAMNGGVANT